MILSTLSVAVIAVSSTSIITVIEAFALAVPRLINSNTPGSSSEYRTAYYYCSIEVVEFDAHRLNLHPHLSLLGLTNRLIATDHFNLDQNYC